MSDEIERIRRDMHEGLIKITSVAVLLDRIDKLEVERDAALVRAEKLQRACDGAAMKADSHRRLRDEAVARTEKAETERDEWKARAEKAEAERDDALSVLATQMGPVIRRAEKAEVERDEAQAKLKAVAPHVTELQEWCTIDGQIGLGAYLEDLCELLEILDPPKKETGHE